MISRAPVLLLGFLACAAVAVADTLPDDWAFRPLRKMPLPGLLTRPQTSHVSTNPIDLFLGARFAEQGWKPGPEADRQTLIRRVHFDLIGLPPTPEDVQAFLRDKRSDAFEEVVERLLASPRYGERWARHWLDVVRFGESQGFEYDRIRDHAWRYRDYVINAFNADKPYDQFIREQLAGDVLAPVTQEGIVATGFLVAGPWDQAGSGSASLSVRAMVREAELEDMLGTIGQTFLGVTLNCARCHDHKFDPIPQSDYYRVKAVFQGVRHGERSILTPGEERLRNARASQKEPKLQPIADSQRPVPMGYVAKPEKPEATFVLDRGEPDKKREQVAPGALSAVTGVAAELGLAADAPEAERRRRFADWVASADNPLTARVIVNRVWHYHFGRGLVATPNDFGRMGERPTHPELLDWLAAWFVAPDGANWSLKKLHRLIVTSGAWRRSGKVEALKRLRVKRGRRFGGDATDPFNPPTLQPFNESDPDNRLLWRFTPRRLEVEAVRDAMLAVSGELNPQMGGPGFRPFRVKGNGNQNEYFAADLLGPDFNRRTVYRICVHSARDPLLDSLDCPEFSTRTPVRPNTTTPLQALSLMNSSFIQRQAAKLAERVEREAGPDLKAQVKSLWMRCYAREPRPAETREASKLAGQHGLASVAWAVLNSNEFVFVQ